MASPRWLPRKRVGVDHQAVEQRQHDPADDHEEEEVLQEGNRAAPGQLIELESLPERFHDSLRDRGEQYTKPQKMKAWSTPASGHLSNRPWATT